MILYLTLGGIVGTLARYLLGGWIQQRTGPPMSGVRVIVSLSR
jgi:fluoride ion exporter CrcB/FEX